MDQQKMYIVHHYDNEHSWPLNRHEKHLFYNINDARRYIKAIIAENDGWVTPLAKDWREAYIFERRLDTYPSLEKRNIIEKYFRKRYKDELEALIQFRKYLGKFVMEEYLIETIELPSIDEN